MTTQTVMMECPTCRERMPAQTAGTTTEDDGRKSQAMACRACKTVVRVYFNPENDDFQINYDWPDA